MTILKKNSELHIINIQHLYKTIKFLRKNQQASHFSATS
jgi:hypothetical protein